MTTNTQVTNQPATTEEALQLADQILIDLLQDPDLSPLQKLRVLTLFYKRFQVGGFAPRARTKKSIQNQPQQPHSSSSGQVSQPQPPPALSGPPPQKPTPPPILPQQGPAQTPQVATHSDFSFTAYKNSGNQQAKTQRRR